MAMNPSLALNFSSAALTAPSLLGGHGTSLEMRCCETPVMRRGREGSTANQWLSAAETDAAAVKILERWLSWRLSLCTDISF